MASFGRSNVWLLGRTLRNGANQAFMARRQYRAVISLYHLALRQSGGNCSWLNAAADRVNALTADRRPLAVLPILTRLLYRLRLDDFDARHRSASGFWKRAEQGYGGDKATAAPSMHREFDFLESNAHFRYVYQE